MGYTLRLSHSQLLGDNYLALTKTQYSKITKAKSNGWNMELKLSKLQIAKNGGAISAIIAKIMPHIIKHASKVLGTLGLAAASGGIQKAISKHRVKTGDKKMGGLGPLMGMMLGSLATLLIGKLFGVRSPGNVGTGLRLPATASKGLPGVKKDEERSNSFWKPLTSIQIDKILRNHGVANYRGTYSKDTIPVNPKGDECLVINLGDYFDGNGVPIGRPSITGNDM